MKRFLPLLFFLLAPFARAVGPISRPGDPGPFLATRGGAAIPTSGGAAHPAPAPAKPAAGPAIPWAVRTPPPVVGPVAPWEPRVTGWSTDGRGRVNGYHVVVPAVDVNPFAGMPLVTTPVAAPPPPPPTRIVRERVYELPPPSAARATAAEEDALEEKLAGEAGPIERAVDEARFRADVLPRVRSEYRFDGTALVPAYAYEVAGATVRRTARPEAAPLPQPSAETILAAFEGGATFLVPRQAPYTVPCGACAGTGRVAARRIVRDDGTPDRIEYAACGRCGGRGTKKTSVTRLFSVTRAAAAD